MLEDRLIELIEPVLREIDSVLEAGEERRNPAVPEARVREVSGPVPREIHSVLEAGEEFRKPPLEVLRYYRRKVRLSWVPILGRALGVVMVVRQPVDVEGSRDGYQRLLA